MEESKAVVPVGVVRERVIQTLSDAFANDLITVDELEDRLAQAYKATTAAEAEALVVGLQSQASLSGEAPLVRARPAELVPPSEKLRSIFSSNERRGMWAVPRKLDVFALFSSTVIDLTSASLPAEMVDITVRARFASVTIIVPPGLRVVNRVGAFMASVESEAALDLAPMVQGAPVIRVNGSAFAASVEIISKKSQPEG